MIIILGSGRSGTTWLGKLFDSHPEVVYRHEPDFFNVSTAIPSLPRRGEAHRYVELKATIYENICADTTSEIRDLFTFADLDWNAQTERFIRRLETSGQQSDRYFSVLRSPVSAVDNWRQELREEQIARILAICSYERIKEIGLSL